VKLLRVVETGEVQALGSGQKQRVDFRLVSAAQDDTPERLDHGLFRHDLFQRLAGVVIDLPLLVDRPEDGYWDDTKQGLAAGEKLQLALRALESSYLEQNHRELELTKNISLFRLDPLAFLALRETGKCTFSVPEEFLDLDFRGHYFRRIKGLRVSIPCVAGPHTSVSCSVRLLNNSIRINTAMNSIRPR